MRYDDSSKRHNLRLSMCPHPCDSNMAIDMFYYMTGANEEVSLNMSGEFC